MKRLIVTAVALSLGAVMSLGTAAPAFAATPTCNTVQVIFDANGPGSVAGWRLPAFNQSTSCVMRSGASGPRVEALQRSLRVCHGQGIVVDGSFGPATRSALINAQRASGVNPDGVYGPNTFRAILHTYYTDARNSGTWSSIACRRGSAL